MTLILISTCCDSRSKADDIARLGVEQGLAACAHVEEIRSVYRWQGEVCEASEWKVSFKTVEGNFDRISALIGSQHSYEEPAIYAVPILRTTDSYGRWVEGKASRETKKAPRMTGLFKGLGRNQMLSSIQDCSAAFGAAPTLFDTT